MSKKALVTGAAKRIGKGISLYLAQQGYDIIAHYHRSIQEAKELKEAIESLGQSCELIQSDLSQCHGDDHPFLHVFEQNKSIDLFVHNASVFEEGSFQKTDYSLLQHHFNVHVFSSFFLFKSYASLPSKSGHIITLLDSSIYSSQTIRFAYLLSKKSLADLTKMLAYELAPHIRVNGILPGYILDPVGGVTDQERLGKINQIPLQSQGSIDDICLAVDYLCKATYVTGTFLEVSGGRVG